MEDIESLRNTLLPIAYQMMGQIQDAEDIVHELIADILEKDAQNNQANIKNITAYYVTATINKSINALKKQKRIDYPGVWLPQPILANQLAFDTQFDVSYAFLHHLSRLNPKERGVFILRKSFDMPFQDIAANLNLATDHCRKLFERSQDKLKDKTLKPTDNQKLNKQLLQEFLVAAKSGDIETLAQHLAHDIILYSDGGGKVSAAMKPILGQNHVAKFLIGIQKSAPKTFSFKLIEQGLNTFIGLYEPEKNKPFSVINLEIVGEKIQAIYIQRNPDKL